MKTCYSLDDETFNHDSLGELLDDMAGDEDGLYVGRPYYEANCEVMTTEHLADDSAVYSLLERMDEDLFEEVGEISDNDFTSVSPEARAELLALVRGWVDKHVNVSRYWRIVGKSRQQRLTAEEVGPGAEGAPNA